MSEHGGRPLARSWRPLLGLLALSLALTSPAGARLRLHRGDAAPAPALVDAAGRPVGLASGATTVLCFVRGGQARSESLLAALPALGEAIAGATVIVAASPRGPLPQLPPGLKAVVARDPEGATFKRYGVVMAPTTVVVDGAGKVVVVIPDVPRNFGARLGAALDAAAGRPYDPMLLAGGEPPAQAAARRHLEQARVLAAAGRPKEALREARAAVAAWPKEVEARLLVGELLLETGAAHEAQATFEAILRDHPGQPRARVGLGRALAATGATARALAVLQEAVRANPNPVRAYYALGRLYEEEGRWREAVEAYRSALAKLKEGRR
ncbi:MAG: tetratricopeptide repeat protein [Nitrospirae bacterium]|nr:MAG: tetratricopeptide repeat protein [Nitrospirota bacterium]